MYKKGVRVLFSEQVSKAVRKDILKVAFIKISGFHCVRHDGRHGPLGDETAPQSEG